MERDRRLSEQILLTNLLIPINSYTILSIRDEIKELLKVVAEKTNGDTEKTVSDKLDRLYDLAIFDSVKVKWRTYFLSGVVGSIMSLYLLKIYA